MLEPELMGLRHLVYRTFADAGRPPSIDEAARILRTSSEAVRAGLVELHARHLLVLAPDGDAIRMAHPFSAAPMGFVVRSGDRRWWGGCAWDSFGIMAALGLPVQIDTTCPACLTELRVVAAPDAPPAEQYVARIPLPAARWWDDVVWTCSNIRTFCSVDHARSHVREARQDLGQVIPIEALWRLAGPWYGDRLDAGYAPRERDRSQALLSRAGLEGEFWRLP